VRTVTQKTNSSHPLVKTTPPARANYARNGHENSNLHLPRTIRRQSVEQAIGPNEKLRAPHTESRIATGFGHDFTRIPAHISGNSVIQPKLKIGAPGDKYEHEADHIADQVMHTSQPMLQRACACSNGNPNRESEQRDKQYASPIIRRVTGKNTGDTVAPPIVYNVLSSPGQPLNAANRAFFEPRFGHDFSNVRIHNDENARASAKAINALAYTSGNHIVIGTDQHSLTSASGKKLLAHELTHVLQQHGTSDTGIQRLSDSDCGSTRSLPLSGSCRSGFIHTCYSETVIPSTSSALNITVSVSYTSPPGPIIEGKEDFSVQVYKCGLIWDTRIGSKRISRTLPDTLRFSIASVTPGDKYYIKIYSRSHLPLDGDYRLAQ